MNDLSKLIRKKIIVFPRPLDKNQIDNYFDYLAENKIRSDYEVVVRVKKEKINSKEYIKEDYISKLSGRLSIPENIHSSSQFECMLKDDLDEINYSTKIYELSFSLLGRDKLWDFHKEEIRLWDKVRKLTQKYFSEVKE